MKLRKYSKIFAIIALVLILSMVIGSLTSASVSVTP